MEFVDAVAVNNYICIKLQDKGYATTHSNRLEIMESLNYQCPVFQEVLKFYRNYNK